MKNLNYLDNQHSNSFSIKFDPSKYNQIDSVKEIYNNKTLHEKFIKNPKYFTNIPGASTQLSELSQHELYKLDNLIYNTSFTENIKNHNYKSSIHNLINTNYISKFDADPNPNPDSPKPRGAIASLVAAVVAGVFGAIEVALGEGIVVGTRIALWTKTYVWCSSLDGSMKRLLNNYHSTKIYHELKEVLFYVENKYSKDIALELDKSILNFALDEIKNKNLKETEFYNLIGLSKINNL